jgi:5'-3' exonuclease
MGINRFRPWLNRYAKSKNARDVFKIDSKKKFKYPVASLFIDVNGLLHNVAGQFFAYNDDRDEISRKKHIAYLKSRPKEEIEEEFFSKIFEEIFEYLRDVRPTEYLILAVDGVAPMAKITQQRKRRFIPKDSKNTSHNLDTEYDDEDAMDVMSSLFDSNAITPGTDFMAKLDYYMLHFLELNTKRSDYIMPEKIVYSSHYVSGEGEHKIFELLREKQVVIKDRDAANIIVGSDADLIMLTMLCPEELLPNILVWRREINNKKDPKTGRPLKVDEDGNPVKSDKKYPIIFEFGEIKHDFFNIGALRKGIYDELSVGIQDIVTEHQIARDFVLMLYLIGNDFVPPVISLTGWEDTDRTISLMFDIYTNYLMMDIPPNSDSQDILLIKDDNSINWSRFSFFLKILADQEKQLLINMYKNLDKKDKFKNKDRPVYRLDILDQSVLKHEDDNQYDINFDKFRNLYYEKALSPHNDRCKKFMMKHQIEGYPYTKAAVQSMIYEYLKGLQWIFQYYSLGTKAVTSRYVYSYFYAPLLSELASTIDYLMLNDSLPTLDVVRRQITDPYITPIHQLMAVMPRKSFPLIPEPYRSLMSKRFADITPYKFKIVQEGTSSDHIKFPVIPFVDPERLISETADYPVPNEYLEGKNIFVVNIRNPKPPSLYKKTYEKAMKVREDNMVVPRTTVVPSTIDSDEDLDEEVVIKHFATSATNPQHYNRESKAELDEAAEKEQKEVNLKALNRRGKMVWTSNTLM